MGLALGIGLHCSVTTLWLEVCMCRVGSIKGIF